jgi:RNA polymerase sigma-70 factor (ECF subfamily)
MVQHLSRRADTLALVGRATSAQGTGTVDDNALVARIREGDEAAFESVFHAHYAPLANQALRYVHSREAAEEVVQRVFCRLWETRASWTVRTTIRGYLYVLVRNAAINDARHHRVVARCEADAVRRGGDFRPGLGEAAGRPADGLALEREVATALHRAIDALPPRTRQAYVLRRDHGLSYAEVAEAMGVTVKNVEKLLGRAQTALREALASYR